MSRYLTPWKVSLLALGVLYTEGVVPTSQSTSLLSFLISHILQDSKHSSSDNGNNFQISVPISVFESALSSHASSIPGRTVFDLFVKKLWAIDCSDALDSFIGNIPGLLAKSREQILRERETGEESDGIYGRILRTSPLGAFIRRCHLEYTRLQFEDSIALWQEFIEYRAPSRQLYEKKNPPDGRNALDVNLSDLQIDSSHPLAQILYGRIVENHSQEYGHVSNHDVEKLMEFQVSEMQRIGGRLPEGMRTKISEMSKAGASMPKLAHYLKFLDSWRAGDYSSAFDNLHRYFDYTMQSRDRTFYQYALLNLAILQADFGCHSEAIPAMQEAIATARENKDTACLNFCMSWLYHFGRSFPSEMKSIRESGILGSETEGLAFLKSRAKDSEMWSLLSTSLLSEAKLGLQHGESLAVVFENIAKASHLNITKATHNIAGPTLLMRAATFSRVGLTHLAWSCGETFLECYMEDAPIEDVLKCKCRMAGILAQRGRYSEANDMLDSVPAHILRVLKFHNYWKFYAGLLKVRRFLHRDDLDAAEYLIRQLKGSGPPDLEISFTLAFLEIDFLIRSRKLSTGLEKVENLAEKSLDQNNDVLIQARLMNLKALILSQSGVPLKGFSVVVRAAQTAYRARTLPTLWESTGILASILLTLHEFRAVDEILNAIMPQVLECQDSYLIARTYSLLADSSMGQAGIEETNSTRQEELMNRATEHVDGAFVHYRHVEDLKGQLEMLRKKATVMHWRGDLVLANDTASQYLELRRQYEDTKV